MRAGLFFWIELPVRRLRRRYGIAEPTLLLHRGRKSRGRGRALASWKRVRCLGRSRADAVLAVRDLRARRAGSAIRRGPLYEPRVARIQPMRPDPDWRDARFRIRRRSRDRAWRARGAEHR